MIPQAAHRDLVVPTGAHTTISFQYREPTKRVTVDQLQPGDVIRYADGPTKVHSNTDLGDGRHRLALGEGLFWEPMLEVDADTQAQVFEVVPIPHGEARWAPKLDSFFRVPPETLALPVNYDTLTKTVSLEFTPEWLEPIALAIDFYAAGPSQTFGVYDVLAQIHGKSVRVLEGSITFIRSTATPPWPSDVIQPPATNGATP